MSAGADEVGDEERSFLVLDNCERAADFGALFARVAPTAHVARQNVTVRTVLAPARRTAEMSPFNLSVKNKTSLDKIS